MQPAGAVHTAFAAASLVLGAVMFRLSKGTVLHRFLGVLYVIGMVVVNVTALTIYRLFGGFGVFHAFALMSLAFVLAGFAVVLLKRPRGAWLTYHYYFMGWTYVGLCAAAGSEVGVRIPGVPFVWGTVVPTVVIVTLGGAWVERSRRSTIASVAPPR